MIPPVQRIRPKNRVRCGVESTDKNMRTNKMTQDAADFLEALLFQLSEDEPQDIREATIYDFSPEFIEGVESFISAFRDFANERNPEALDSADNSPRSFGGNVYFSLSGHGVGFWDSADTEAMQPLLEEFSGSKYRFEQISLDFREDGKLDLAFIPEALPEYRAKLFSWKGKPE